MTTTVRIREEDKERLRRLQESWHRKNGRYPAQQEVLAKGLEYLERNREQFLSAVTWRPLTDAEFERIKKVGVYSWKGGVDDIDDIVYGDER